MTELGDALAQVERHLERLDRRVLLRELAPGVPVERVRDELASVDLVSTPEIETFFGWHDGLSETPGLKLDDIYLFSIFYPLSLSELTDVYRSFRGNVRWKDGWLPIMFDGAGDFYVVDLSDSGDGQVRHFWNEQLETPVEFDSLTTMFQTISAAYDRGLIFLDEDGYLDDDYQAFGDLAREMNPNSYFWRG